MISLSKLPNLAQFPVVAFDTETTGLDYPKDSAFAFSIAVSGEEAWYFDVRRQPRAVDWLNEQLRRPPSTIVCHNAGFDYCMASTIGIELPPDILDDTAIRACLLNEHESTRFPWTHGKPGTYSLDDLCKKYVGRGKLQIDVKNIYHLPYEEAAEYGEEDAKLAWLLWQWQEEQIKLRDMRKICDFERSVMPAIIKRQRAGIRVDIAAAEKAMDLLVPVIAEKQAKLNHIAGWSVNVNSGPQMVKLFQPQGNAKDGYHVNGIRVGTTDSGGPSLRAEYLLELASANEAASLVAQIRSDLKTKDTFLGSHVLQHTYGDRVYPTINQTAGEMGGTRTGRLSYVDPAMQQIPSRDKRVASIVKPVFMPDDGHSWFSFDLASFEVRIFAALVGKYDARIVQQYRSDPKLDFHKYVAGLTNLPRNATRPGEANAKQLNLSMIFCQGPGATAAKMGMPVTESSFTDEWTKKEVKYFRPGPEAMRIIDIYHSRITGVKDLSNAAKQTLANRNGAMYKGEKHPWIQTKYGRRLRFPKMFKAYKGSGLLIQATAADINKENWKLLDEGLADMGASLILNTHDSYEVQAPIGSGKKVKSRVEQLLQRDFLGVPLLVDFNGCGPNWWGALQGENDEFHIEGSVRSG